MKLHVKSAKTSIKTLVLCSLGALIFTITPQSNNAKAQTIADSPCDIDGYYESLKSRAWLEAQREITQNQNIIYKPDSVLEYTCFDRFANTLIQNAVFSDTNNLRSTLNTIVGQPLSTYLDTNFDRRIQGSGTYELLGGHGGGNYTPQTMNGGSYSCSVMNSVWFTAKCMDFAPSQYEEGFYTLEEYADNDDRRTTPDLCPRVDAWGAQLTRSGLRESSNSNDAPPWQDDPVQTYLSLIDDTDCANSDPIDTGITVTRPNGNPRTYNEKVCIKPGCHYVPDGVDSGSCSNN